MELHEFAFCDNAMFEKAWEDLTSFKALRPKQSLTVKAMVIATYIHELVQLNGSYQLAKGS